MWGLNYTGLQRVMKKSHTDQLLKYWNKVRAGRQAPTRVEIVPSEINTILPYTFILEINDIEQLTYRLAGSHICDCFGKEFRGEDFYADWPQSERPILRRYLSKLTQKGAVISLSCTATSERDHEGEFEMLFLPLTHSGERIDRILGAITAKKEWAWLGVTPLKFREIEEISVTLHRGSSLAAGTVKNGQIMPFLPHKRLVRGKNCQLKVYDGGKSDITL